MTAVQRLVLLGEAADGLLARCCAARRHLLALDVPRFVPDKLARKLLDRFPAGIAGRGAGGPGADAFARAAPAVLEAFGEWCAVLVDWTEWRDHSLRLLTELSRELGSLAFSHAELVLVPYFELATKHVQLQLLLGSVLSGANPRGRLAAAAYTHAHRMLGLAPSPDWPAAAAGAAELSAPVAALQADFAGVRLRVADALVPLAPLLLALADPASLQHDAMLWPYAAGEAIGGTCGGCGACVGASGGACGGGGCCCSSVGVRGGSCHDRNPAAGGMGLPGLGCSASPLGCDTARLLPLAWRAHRWAIYGFLACPEELASPGAPELLLGVLRCSQALDIGGELKVLPHAYFEVEPRIAGRWLGATRGPGSPHRPARRAPAAPAAPSSPVSSASSRASSDPKLFAAAVREARGVAARAAPAARASARAALAFKMATLTAHARAAAGGGMAGAGIVGSGVVGSGLAWSDRGSDACVGVSTDTHAPGGATPAAACTRCVGEASALVLLPLVLSALRLAQAEMEWWATHAGASPEEVKRSRAPHLLALCLARTRPMHHLPSPLFLFTTTKLRLAGLLFPLDFL